VDEVHKPGPVTKVGSSWVQSNQVARQRKCSKNRPTAQQQLSSKQPVQAQATNVPTCLTQGRLQPAVSSQKSAPSKLTPLAIEAFKEDMMKLRGHRRWALSSPKPNANESSRTSQGLGMRSDCGSESGPE